MVLVEAMSYGLPVIAFDNSAVPYTVKDGLNGLLVKNNSVEDLKHAMKRLLVDEGLRNRLSIGALEYYKTTRIYEDWNRDIDKFIQSL